ncbi:MAG: nitrilase-related carbon-nitrogen hydrolase [Anaerolineaceae bacterium]|nr:nitrilase-related carbon-nitrogen hydrolase [Anaerolineaceae bacterium]
MKAGFFQFKPKGDKPEYNAQIIKSFCDSADFDFLVLPSHANGLYYHEDKQSLKKASERCDGSGPFLSSMIDLAKEHDACIVAGFSEMDGKDFYISSAAVTSNGVLSVYRKMHLYLTEFDLYTPGNLGFNVFEFKNTHIGMIIAFDWIYPEACRTLALRGAQIIAHPCSLALEWGQDAMKTRSIENQVFSITANRIGEEFGFNIGSQFTGKSQIIGHRGIRMIQAPSDEIYFGLVDIDPSRTNDKHITPFNDLFTNRRADYYECCCAKAQKPEQPE